MYKEAWEGAVLCGRSSPTKVAQAAIPQTPGQPGSPSLDSIPHPLILPREVPAEGSGLVRALVTSLWRVSTSSGPAALASMA